MKFLTTCFFIALTAAVLLGCSPDSTGSSNSLSSEAPRQVDSDNAGPVTEPINDQDKATEVDDDLNLVFLGDDPQHKHQIGSPSEVGWTENRLGQSQKFLTYGPYLKTLAADSHLNADFYLKIDDVSGDDRAIVTLDVHDANTGKILAIRTVTRKEFKQSDKFQIFRLAFRNPLNSILEFRVFHHGYSRIVHQRTQVKKRTMAAGALWVRPYFSGPDNRTYPLTSPLGFEFQTAQLFCEQVGRAYGASKPGSLSMETPYAAISAVRLGTQFVSLEEVPSGALMFATLACERDLTQKEVEGHIQSFYSDILNREGRVEEVQSWLEAYNKGLSVTFIRDSFETSEEACGTLCEL